MHRHVVNDAISFSSFFKILFFRLITHSF
jgi:hypothetical protein